MNDDMDQDEMAEEWAAAMAEQDDNSQDDIDALRSGNNDAPAAKSKPAAERAPKRPFQNRFRLE